MLDIYSFTEFKNILIVLSNFIVLQNRDAIQAAESQAARTLHGAAARGRQPGGQRAGGAGHQPGQEETEDLGAEQSLTRRNGQGCVSGPETEYLLPSPRHGSDDCGIPGCRVSIVISQNIKG